MKDKWKNYFAEVCIATAKLSHARKLKVGCIAVKDNRVIATGYNGRLPGEPNKCEEEIKSWNSKENCWELKLSTRPDVEHAERNLICYSARKGIALEDAALFITHSPCIECARAIINAGFVSVYYWDDFNEPEAIYLLKRHSVATEKLGELPDELVRLFERGVKRLEADQLR